MTRLVKSIQAHMSSGRAIEVAPLILNCNFVSYGVVQNMIEALHQMPLKLATKKKFGGEIF